MGRILGVEAGMEGTVFTREGRLDFVGARASLQGKDTG
jgi:hypothetical protein